MFPLLHLSMSQNQHPFKTSDVTNQIFSSNTEFYFMFFLYLKKKYHISILTFFYGKREDILNLSCFIFYILFVYDDFNSHVVSSHIVSSQKNCTFSLTFFVLVWFTGGNYKPHGYQLHSDATTCFRSLNRLAKLQSVRLVFGIHFVSSAVLTNLLSVAVRGRKLDYDIPFHFNIHYLLIMQDLA